ncbi:MAG: Gfo/Idh/MocA family oxidoreductase [Lachnospiraceae bacterium]|nr:Gfo/Idh/MocA family oxidoreductase [Lachnospiraceae bacterium]
MGFQFGIIGAGAMSGRMADTVRRMKDVDLYAIAARSEEKAKQFAEQYGAETYYGSYEALMEDEQVELIYIALPNHLHYQVARECIQHGKPVLLEKPFTLNENQADNLIRLAEMHQVFLCEAMWVRFMPMIHRIKKELDNERIGEVISITTDMGYDLREKERLLRLDMGGGALLDIGVYPLSLILQLMGGDIENISTSVVHMNSGVDAQEMINLTYHNGAMAGSYVTMLANTPKKAVIYGTEGRIEVDDINCYREYRIYDRDGALLETTEKETQISGLEYEVRACVNAIRSGKLECPEMTHYDTLFQMRVLDSIRKIWNLQFPQEKTMNE